MPFAVIESMTTICVGRYTIRVWRAENEVLDHYDNPDLLDKAYQLGAASQAALAEGIGQMPRVNAVEVKDEGGDGVVLYHEWP